MSYLLSRLSNPLTGRRSLLSLALLSCLLLVFSVTHLRAEDGEAAAVRGVIESQIAAFREDNGQEAFSFAAPVVQEKFGSSATFMQMVERGYPQIYRPAEVEFLEFERRAHQAVQRVRLLGEDGVSVIALYKMEQQDDGLWRIAGVMIEPQPDLTT